eukprot:1160756-Pelagomonas_calceolata.AAC.2
MAHCSETSWATELPACRTGVDIAVPCLCNLALPWFVGGGIPKVRGPCWHACSAAAPSCDIPSLLGIRYHGPHIAPACTLVSFTTAETCPPALSWPAPCSPSLMQGHAFQPKQARAREGSLTVGGC